MKPDFLGRWLQTRRILKTLDRIAAAQERQTLYIARLVEHLCGPEVTEVTPEALKTHSGVTFSADHEQVRMLDLADRFEEASGRPPTDEELMDLMDGRR